MREQAVMRLVVVSNHHNAPSSHTSSFTHKSTKEKQHNMTMKNARPTRLCANGATLGYGREA